MLITFEGIDFCGKTTQIKLLSEYLIRKKKKVITIREPGGTEIAETLRQILLEPKNKMNSFTELFLFEAARSDLVEKVIKPALTEGSIVLCDRFWDSTIAYQVFGRKLPEDFVNQCNFYSSQGIKPDITFLIDISLETMLRRSKSLKIDRFENEEAEFIKNVIEGFRTIAKLNQSRFVILDGDEPIEEIHKRIVEVLSNKFGL
ncbi:MAG: dTMP kinase [Ignavibacteria bacterium]|nr:dTMP kinase [Ignavibacteria bacterium]